MTDVLISILGFVLAVGILVTVHEFGHFWVARMLGVKVIKFSIGFGRSLWSWYGRKDNTEYAIAMIPLGGYVRMLDESEGDVAEEEKARAFNRQSLATRSAVVVAGPLFNFLFAILAYWLVFGIGVEGLKPVVGQVVDNSIADKAGVQPGDRIISLDGRAMQTWSEHNLYTTNQLLDGEPVALDVQTPDGKMKVVTLSLGERRYQALSPSGLNRILGMGPELPALPSVLGEISENFPAHAAGLMAGDRITSIDGSKIDTWGELVTLVSENPGKSMLVEFLRSGAPGSVILSPQAVMVNDRQIGRIGVRAPEIPLAEDYWARVELGLGEQFGRAIENTWLMSALTLKMLYRMIRLEVSAENLSGPITIAHYAGQSVQIGLVPFLMFLGVISVSLGVLNLLPIPVLDGGHLLYYLIELIQGGPVSERVMYWGQQVGLLMIAGLMGLAFYNDILRLMQ